MIPFPKSFAMVRPVPQLVTCDPASLSDNCQEITLTDDQGNPHVLPIIPLRPHAAMDLAVPFAAGDLDGYAPGRYIVLRQTGGDALAAFYLGNG